MHILLLYALKVLQFNHFISLTKKKKKKTYVVLDVYQNYKWNYGNEKVRYHLHKNPNK